MKHNFAIALLVTLFLSGTIGAYAQTDEPGYGSRKERKRHDREERRRRTGRYRYYDDADQEALPKVKKFTVDYPQSVVKNRYRVEVLVPLYLDELSKGESARKAGNIPDMESGLYFYEGVKIAADSLRKNGVKMDLYIHDIVSAGESTEQLLAKNKLDSADLIIGAVTARDLPSLAALANNKQINFVSVTSTSDAGVRGNPYFTMLQPSLKSHCEWIVNDVAQKYAGQRVLLLHRRSVEADSAAWRYIIKSTNADRIDLKKQSCAELPSREKLLRVIDTTRPNVIILSVLDNAYADTVLKLVSGYFPGTHFEVYGMPSWKGMPALTKKKAYPNMTINVTSAFNFDPASPSGKYLGRVYKKDYGAKPSEMVYRGYETMFWYASLLKQYGTVFNPNYNDNAAAPFNKLEVKPQWDKDGNIMYHENTHAVQTVYEGGVSSVKN